MSTQIVQEVKEPLTVVQNSVEHYYEVFLNTVPRLVIGVGIIVLGVLVAQLITNFYRKRFLKKSEDPLMARFLAQSIKLVLIGISATVALKAAGLDGLASGVITAVGGGAIVLGFAFQDIGKNFLAGIILAFNRPFDINDTIMVDTHFGKVRALNFRYTHIKTTNGRDIFIPNSDVLTKPVANYTSDGFFRIDFTVGIGYDDDLDLAIKIIENVLATTDGIVKNDTHKSFVMEDELAASTINLKVFFWVHTIDYNVTSNILQGRIINKVLRELTDAGMMLPGNITEIKLYGGQKDFPFRLNKSEEDTKA